MDGVGSLDWYNEFGDGLRKREVPAATQIFHVSYPGGTVSRVTNDLLEYGPTSLSITKDASDKDGDRLSYRYRWLKDDAPMTATALGRNKDSSISSSIFN